MSEQNPGMERYERAMEALEHPTQRSTESGDPGPVAEYGLGFVHGDVIIDGVVATVMTWQVDDLVDLWGDDWPIADDVSWGNWPAPEELPPPIPCPDHGEPPESGRNLGQAYWRDADGIVLTRLWCGCFLSEGPE